jgi:Tol biopolymer transport system component
LTEAGAWFEASSWSSDGRKLAGFQLSAEGRFTGINVYSFQTRDYTRMTDFGHAPTWLKDGRRLLFSGGIESGAPRDAAIYLVDSQSRKIHQVFSAEPNSVATVTISADNRWVYFPLEVIESDIWLANSQ